MPGAGVDHLLYEKAVDYQQYTKRSANSPDYNKTGLIRLGEGHSGTIGISSFKPTSDSLYQVGKYCEGLITHSKIVIS